MSDAFFTFLETALLFFMCAFLIAWVTILPTIGLLYWMGYLK